MITLLTYNLGLYRWEDSAFWERTECTQNIIKFAELCSDNLCLKFYAMVIFYWMRCK